MLGRVYGVDFDYVLFSRLGCARYYESGVYYVYFGLSLVSRGFIWGLVQTYVIGSGLKKETIFNDHLPRSVTAWRKNVLL